MSRTIGPTQRHNIRCPAELAARISLICCDEDGKTIYGALSQFYTLAAEELLRSIEEGKAEFSPTEQI